MPPALVPPHPDEHGAARAGDARHHGKYRWPSYRGTKDLFLSEEKKKKKRFYFFRSFEWRGSYKVFLFSGLSQEEYGNYSLLWFLRCAGAVGSWAGSHGASRAAEVRFSFPR